MGVWTGPLVFHEKVRGVHPFAVGGRGTLERQVDRGMPHLARFWNIF